MALTIVGQATKTLDATSRTPAALKIRDLSLRLETIADDSLTWTARTQDLEATATILPDIEQTVSLYQGATRIFHGHVSDPRDMPYGTRVTVLGPWWWLRRTQLTQAGTAGDRPTYDLPEATVAANLTALLTRAIAKGCPIGIGTIASTLTIPAQKLSEMTFADAIADQLKWIADGVAWWDYSASPPTFNLTRRAGATDTTYATGAAGQITDFEVSPQTELRAERVELTYMTGTGSSAVEAQQVSGTAAAGRTQVIAISGPERAESEPQELDFSDRLPVFLATTSAADALKHATQGLPALIATWPELAVKVNSVVSPYTPGGSGPQPVDVATNTLWDYETLGTFETELSAVPSGKTAILLGLDGRTSPPEWLATAYGLEKWTAKDFYVTDGQNSTSSPPFNSARRADIWRVISPNYYFFSQNANGTGNGAASYVHLVRRFQEGSDPDMTVWLLPTANVPSPGHSGTARASTSASQIQLATAASSTDDAYTGMPIFWTKNGQRYGAWITNYVGSTRIATLSASQQTEHAPASGQAYQVTGFFFTSVSSTYGYVAPPAGMAADLLAMQNWTPWAGRIVRKGSAVDGIGGLARKYNISGARAALASMGALPRAVTYEFAAKTVTIELGSPARHDFGTLAQRFRQSPQSNLT